MAELNMNILHLESSGSWGGQEYRTCLEINWLNANGHRAWLICDPTSEVMTKARELGTPVIPMSLKHRINPLMSFRIWLFCRRNRVDLIKSYSSKDHWLCLPLYLCGWPVTRARCITDPLGKKNRAFIYRHGCAKIVADAQVIKKEFIEQYGITPKKIEVIGSAVDLEKFSPNLDRMKFRREVGLSLETPIIVNIGMIRPDKGQFNLVEAARIVRHQRPDAHFVFVGEATGGRSREKWVRKAIDRAGLNGNVLMMGYRWDIPDILAAANMVVIASRHTEASPIVLREAFASGRPVVATRVGDVPEIIIHGENGLIVQPNDSNALATAILLFLSDENLAARCADNGLRYAREHFCFDRMMRAKLDIDLALVEATRKHRASSKPRDVASELATIATPEAVLPD
jgi:glycosyltransferase involved in cell wall biosynthesis